VVDSAPRDTPSSRAPAPDYSSVSKPIASVAALSAAPAAPRSSPSSVEACGRDTDRPIVLNWASRSRTVTVRAPIPAAVRRAYATVSTPSSAGAQAYASDQALTAGFDWYRMLRHDATVNVAATGSVNTPLLYLRGEHEGGDIDAYVTGFHDAGLTDVRSALIDGAGHFAAEDAPAAVWNHLVSFITDTR